MVAELQRTFDVYYILPTGTSYSGDKQILGYWRDLLGQNVIELDDLDAVCETIALTVGLGEEAIDLDAGVRDLADLGSTAGATVGKALATVGSQRGAVVRTAVPGLPAGPPTARL
jgi:hypothetical protein